MKKKKLQLNRETLRNLSRDDLKQVVGGTTSEGCTRPISCCESCNDFCTCDTCDTTCC